MQALRAYRDPRRAISIEALLVWTFRAQRAELDPPRDHDRDRPAVGAEWIIFQRGAVLGCTIDCSRRVLPDRTHDDAETVAAVVAGALDWHMATRVAELARAGRRPTCITGPVRCTAAEWQENQHARWPAVAPALPAKFPGGVWRLAMKDRKGRERYEGYCTPVTYDPTPQQVAASRRDYLAWWAAIHEVRERLLAATVLRDHELTAAMRRRARGRFLTTRARKWIDFFRAMVDKSPCDELRPAAERLTGRFAFGGLDVLSGGAATANPLIVRFLSGAECMRER